MLTKSNPHFLCLDLVVITQTLSRTLKNIIKFCGILNLNSEINVLGTSVMIHEQYGYA